MKDVMAIACTTVIMLIQMAAMFWTIKKADTEVLIILGKKDRHLMVAAAVVAASAFYMRYGLEGEYYLYAFLTGYLLVTAFIDRLTMQVYSVFNLAAGAIGAGYLIYQALQGRQMETAFICLAVYALLVRVQTRTGMYGEGDGEIYIVVSLFLCSREYELPLLYLLYNMILAALIFMVSNRRQLDLRRWKMKEEAAFAPSIAAATILLLLL
ncbi:prepilin peptidase [Anaerobium acetethylicum]|uniref:Type IV leader peptidase family protein n=1 Tax=Anaerobium acetethylicum TaxID=1619234 RepID=A0A1D3TXH8_9FIRM|nr:prepilin peptidase [Anaerobium acetethylicum]SCP99056.1 Type IV leader peptidase family protein [Anaerobium acetethylicum]